MSFPKPLTVSSAPVNSSEPAKSDDSSVTIPLSRYVLYFGLAAVGAAADLLSKHFIFQWRGMPQKDHIWWLIDSFCGIETATNSGALFGMGPGKSWLFATLSIIAAISIPVWLFVFKAGRDNWLTVALGLVTGGIFGNLYDRLGLWSPPGHPEMSIPEVRDWILFQFAGWNWPNFNIADCLLVCGAILLVLHALFQKPATEQNSEKVASKV